MICEIPMAGGRLVAVPAVHYRVAFAEAVNLACANPVTRPAAVAVELGDGAVREIVAWLRDLGLTERRGQAELPCMLGLVRPNRLIHPAPRFREQALRLQERHGLPLRKLPPEVLRRELHYASLSLICLSATDSIIEAIRSAVEWDLPLYGVDLDDFAHLDRKPVTIEDPLVAAGRIAEYAARNAAHAAECRDDTIDDRREQYMAARLRTVVARHGRVLFTGGLAHWDALVRLLAEHGPRLEDQATTGNVPVYERVIVDPALAIYQMDVFPDVTLQFEKRRRLPAGTAGRKINIRELVLERIESGYIGATNDGLSNRSARNLVSEFLAFLGNLSLVHQRTVPDLFLSLLAARTMVSTDFAESFGRALINGAMPWTRPEEHPGLRWISPLPSSGADRQLADHIRKTRLIAPAGASGPHFISSPDEDLPVEPSRAQTVMLEPFLPPPPGGGGEQHDHRNGVWPPCENLFYGTAYKAAEIALTHARQAAVEPFSGTLFDGIDCKATARAAARGDNRPYVRVRTVHRTAAPDSATTEPFVYIFGEGTAGQYAGADWGMTRGWDLLDGLIQEKYRERFGRVTRRYGHQFVAAIYFSEQRAPEARLAHCRGIAGVKLLWGAVAFGNPCLNAHQSARWVEEGLEVMVDHDFRRCPVIPGHYDFASFPAAFQARHGIQLDTDNWTDTLIRIAIQYARHRTVVIAPSYGVFSPHARMEARARGVSLDFHPLSHFSAERISAIRKQYFVHPLDDQATQWPADVVALLGGNSDAHIDLLPPFIRAQTIPLDGAPE